MKLHKTLGAELGCDVKGAGSQASLPHDTMVLMVITGTMSLDVPTPLPRAVGFQTLC